MVKATIQSVDAVVAVSDYDYRFEGESPSNLQANEKQVYVGFDVEQIEAFGNTNKTCGINSSLESLVIVVAVGNHEKSDFAVRDCKRLCEKIVAALVKKYVDDYPDARQSDYVLERDVTISYFRRIESFALFKIRVGYRQDIKREVSA